MLDQGKIVPSAPSTSQGVAPPSLKDSVKKSAPLRAVVNPRVNFATMLEPNCERLAGRSSICAKLRREAVADDGRDYESLDTLVITFEGVLGAFLRASPLKSLREGAENDTLVLRPGVAYALSILIDNFKVVILTTE